jgi:hypothetical protein
MLGPGGDYAEHIGRVRWILSLPNGSQFVVVQRMSENAPLCGIETLPRLKACLDHGHSGDSIKRHCASLRLRPKNVVASYHIIRLTEHDDADEIEDIVLLQPDFSEAIPEVTGAEHQSYFRLDYIIQ